MKHACRTTDFGLFRAPNIGRAVVQGLSHPDNINGTKVTMNVFWNPHSFDNISIISCLHVYVVLHGSKFAFSCRRLWLFWTFEPPLNPNLTNHSLNPKRRAPGGAPKVTFPYCLCKTMPPRLGLAPGFGALAFQRTVGVSSYLGLNLNSVVKALKA